MLSTFAQLRRIAHAVCVPETTTAPKAGATPLITVDPASTLDAWRHAKIDVPPYMFEKTGPRRALRQPVLAVPSGHSMHAQEAAHMGVPHVPNRILREAMERLVAGEPDWDEALCPITLDLMHQPTQIASPLFDGDTDATHIEDHAYELKAIEGWFAACSQIAPTLQGAMPTSPMTRARLRYPITLVANVPAADMCRARRGLPPLNEEEQRLLHRACREASRQLNRGTGQARDAFQLIACILMGGLGIAFAIEIFATRDHRSDPDSDFTPPAHNDTEFWRACLHVEIEGKLENWPWTQQLARQACLSPDPVCREATRQLIEELCVHTSTTQQEHHFWVPPQDAQLSRPVPCLFLCTACHIGNHAFLTSPHYRVPSYNQTAAELMPYHMGALAVLAACTLGSVAIYKWACRRSHAIEVSPV